MADIRFVKTEKAYLAQSAGDSANNSASRPLLLGARLHVDMSAAANGWVPARTPPNKAGLSRSGFVQGSDLSNREQLKVFYTDVGQGDATLIEAEGGIVIIDGGPNRGFYDVLIERFESLQRADQDAGLAARTSLFINAVVITHFDKDHYYGLKKVFEDGRFHFGALYHNGLPRYGVNTGKDLELGDLVEHQDGTRSISIDLSDVASAKEMIDSGLLKTSSGGDNLFAKFLMAVIKADGEGRLGRMRRLYRRRTTGASPLVPNLGSDLKLEVVGPVTTKTGGPPRLPVFPDPHDITPTNPNPVASESHTINGNSVVLRLRYKNKLFLFGGDLNNPAQRYLDDKYDAAPPIEAHINKACHHGSSDYWLSYMLTVKAEATVFSSGDNGSYDHPMPDAMGIAGKAAATFIPLVFSTELARDNKTSGEIMLGHINARSNGDVVVMAQKKEKAGSKNPWHTFEVPYQGPFGHGA